MVLTRCLPKEQAEVIKSLPTLRFPLHGSMRRLTFLITPEFMSWFDEGNDFTQRALSRLHQNLSDYVQHLRRRSETYQLILQSRVAVVDRIPFPDGTGSGCAGIAFAVTRTNGIWTTKTDRVKTSLSEGDGVSEAPLISVKLPFPYRPGEKKRKMMMLLRPANTLFVNGLQSTMFTESWVWNDGKVGEPEFLRHSAREHLDRINMTHFARDSSLTAPLQRLTETREISMCMGNVISKLVGKGKVEPTSASLELEEKVSALMKSKEATSGTLNVFALITPEKGRGREHKPGQVASTQMLGYKEAAEPTGGAAEDQRTLNSIRLAITKGAHLHRVTSGGGGWGKKQGLLSLEPAVGFDSEQSNVSPPRVAEAFEESLETDVPTWDRHSLQVASPGDTIEFFGTFWSKEEEEVLLGQGSSKAAEKAPNTRLWDDKTWTDDAASKVTWGVIPPQDSNGASIVPTFGNHLITLPHYFGMLSERGMALQRMDYDCDAGASAESAAESERVTEITRIDVPHTLLTYSMANVKGRSRRVNPRQDGTLQSTPQDGAGPTETRLSDDQVP
jgi:hypothetical protein